MNSQVLIDREWFDRVHALLYKVSSEESANGLEAECLGSFIPGFLQATPAPIPDAGEGVDWLLHCLEDRYPDSEERVTVEVFADWLRDNVSALRASAMVVPDGFVLADKKALGTVLQALVNAPHYIRELQATREPVALFGNNPINILIASYEAPASKAAEQ